MNYAWSLPALLLLSLGCVPAQAGHQHAAPAAAPPKTSDPRGRKPLLRTAPDLEAPTDRAPRPPEPAADPCPSEMAHIVAERTFCIDRWEAHIALLKTDGPSSAWPPNRTLEAVETRITAVSEPGQLPQGYISGAEAALACERAGKRLCDLDEWVAACRGPKNTRYPYGDQRQPDVCNDRFSKLDHHPVVRLFKAHAEPGTPASQMWLPQWMNDPRLFELDHTVVPAGSFERCTNEYGVYDMVGNLHEWVVDPEGTFVGGFFMDTFQNGEGCEYVTRAHPFDYHDYSTGFRCCRDPVPSQ